MRVNNSLIKASIFIIALLSAAAHAEGDKASSSVIPSEDIQEGEVIHVIKLDDILNGKYSKKQESSKEAAPAPEPTTNDKKNTLVDSKKKPSIEKPVATNDSIDLTAAFNAVMGGADAPENQSLAHQNQAPKKPVEKTAVATSSNGTGWLYLGKLSKGQWDQTNNQVLGLKAVLPKVGKQYSIRVFSNIRKGYPSKKGMPPIVKVLAQGSKIKLLAVHNSGKSGHYWAKVQW
ncbi:MAG TPA: hypothetical protein EYG68_08910 [Leucothrix mucor]|nr:hypothetical protein [Leucothrix mucor]